MKGLYLKHFVLNPRDKREGDPYAQASRLAILKYADSIRPYNNSLAEDLCTWLEAIATDKEVKDER